MLTWPRKIRTGLSCAYRTIRHCRTQGSSAWRTALHLMAFGGCVLCSLSATADTTRTTIAAFAPGSLVNWETKSFEGTTQYQLMGKGPQRVLKAHCDGSASAIALRQPVDLTKTPILHWEWRVDHVYKGLDGTKKAGDDYAARLYVIHDGGWLAWRTRAINYVWANTQPVGTHWPNAFTDKAMMVATQSGTPNETGNWVAESRNVRADFRRFYDMNLKTLDGIAIMTDCDNSERSGTAYYRNIYFTRK